MSIKYHNCVCVCVYIFMLRSYNRCIQNSESDLELELQTLTCIHTIQPPYGDFLIFSCYQSTVCAYPFNRVTENNLRKTSNHV